VFPQFQGRGLARRLFEEAEAHARSRKIRRLRLFVNPHNQAAYSLYEGLGFEPQTHEMRLVLGNDPANA
ncbi:MAG: GNAT family N-acetyltransferase, partial [Cyanobacteria bacterium REEB65]|nr:GNAT family N-acetyltransferase [Cyanobacteria bacterium REEB65]